MRKAIFIRSLEIEEIMVSSVEGAQHQYYDMRRVAPIRGTSDLVVSMSEDITVPVVNVHAFFKRDNGQTEELYMAYSKDVQKFLGTPFDAIRQQSKDVERSLIKSRDELEKLKVSIDDAGLIARFKYLFTGKLIKPVTGP